MVAGVPELDGRLPLCFYSTISRRAVSSTWADKYLIYQTLSGALDWLQLSKMHMPLQPPNTHLSPPVVIPTPLLFAECLICFHHVACTVPVLPSSIRAIYSPTAPAIWKMLLQVWTLAIKADMWFMACFIASAPLFPLGSPSSKETITHKPQLREAWSFELPFQPSRPGDAAFSSHPPCRSLHQLQAWGSPSMSLLQELSPVFKPMEKKHKLE